MNTKYILYTLILIMFPSPPLCSKTPLSSADWSEDRVPQNARVAIISTVFDGRWWTSVDEEEQIGFVSGYYDCYQYDLRKGVKSDASYEEWQNAANEYYAQAASHLDSPVPLVLRRLFRTLKTKSPRPKGGEHWREPHGFFDGLWWIGGTEKERIGFVEGYVWCRSKEDKKNRLKFSGTAEKYAGLLNQYFDDSRNEERKVAHALYRFRDR
jgi:hypothetical protein